MYINELSKLILNTSEDCRNEFDEYIQTSINVSRIIADINNKKDFKEINVVDNNLSINAVNNSILIDDKKTLNLVKQVVAQRGVNSRVRYDIPESFDMISESTFSKIQEIDKIHRANIISRDIAIEMIADLFEGEAIRTEFEKHIDNLYLEKLKKLYELMEIKYQDLLHALNTGKIDQKQFLESYSKLRELQRNSISELITSDETLRRHTR